MGGGLSPLCFSLQLITHFSLPPQKNPTKTKQKQNKNKKNRTKEKTKTKRKQKRNKKKINKTKQKMLTNLYVAWRMNFSPLQPAWHCSSLRIIFAFKTIQSNLSIKTLYYWKFSEFIVSWVIEFLGNIPLHFIDSGKSCNVLQTRCGYLFMLSNLI